MSYEDWDLGEEFWADFVSEYWEKKPTVIPSPFRREIATEAELLAVLGNPTLEGSELYVEGQRQESIPDGLLPQVGEVSLDGFADRLRTTRDLRNYQFTLYGAQRFNPELLFRARSAFSPFYDLVGLPAQSFNTDIFCGEYLTTATGLHKDNAAVFSYVVRGAKKMLVWPFEYFAAEATPAALRNKEALGGVDYREHRKAAVELQGEPGDLLYWPSTSWHVAVGDGNPHMTFNMSPYFPARISKWTNEIIAPMFREAVGEDDWVSFFPYKRTDLQRLAETLPERVEETLSIYQAVLSSERLRGRLMVGWLEALTGAGFHPIPQPDTSAEVHGDGSYIAAAPEYPVVHVVVGDTKELVAANGIPFLARRGPVLEHLLEAVNSGEAFSLGAIVQRVAEDPRSAGLAEESSRTEVTSYLRRLLGARAIRST